MLAGRHGEGHIGRHLPHSREDRPTAAGRVVGRDVSRHRVTQTFLSVPAAAPPCIAKAKKAAKNKSHLFSDSPRCSRRPLRQRRGGGQAAHGPDVRHGAVFAGALLGETKRPTPEGRPGSGEARRPTRQRRARLYSRSMGSMETGALSLSKLAHVRQPACPSDSNAAVPAVVTQWRSSFGAAGTGQSQKRAAARLVRRQVR